MNSASWTALTLLPRYGRQLNGPPSCVQLLNIQHAGRKITLNEVPIEDSSTVGFKLVTSVFHWNS
jgi:hypothetical protein